MTPDPITLRRVHNLWQTTRTFGLREITTAWAAHTLVRIDGGPPPDPGQLGPALRALGYTPVRRRSWPPPGQCLAAPAPPAIPAWPPSWRRAQG